MSATDIPKSQAIEDYCKAIFALQGRSDGAVTTTALAERLAITPGSVSAMLRKLVELGLVEHVPYRGVTLTQKGRAVALEVIRHHRLIELFLAETLHMPWDRVHEEAEVLEHVISEELERLIAEKLGDPKLDPHGDPIPSADLEFSEGQTISLASLEPGDGGVLVRVSDSDPEMLRYLSERGIAPGDRLRVLERQPFGGAMLVSFEGTDQTVGGLLASAMRVELDMESRRASGRREGGLSGVGGVGAGTDGMELQGA
jgi:DtxR family transcriptional regulator, Mn-dependent transcriptional regulator